MHSVMLVMAIILLVIGLWANFRSMSQLTDTGRTTPWYRRFRPIWKQNPCYSVRGQELVRLSGLTMSTGVILYLVSRFVG